jgi:hypothetical protein
VKKLPTFNGSNEKALEVVWISTQITWKFANDIHA